MLDFDVEISDLFYNQIMSTIGYPVIDDTIFAHLMTRQQVIDTVIKPSLFDFSTFFPDQEQHIVSVSGGGGLGYLTATDFSDLVFAIANYKFVSSSSTWQNSGLMSQGSFYNNPFYSAAQVVSTGGSTSSRYGTPYGYGHENNIYQGRFYQKSVENMNKVYYAKWKPKDRQVEYKSSIAGTFEINLAVMNTNVDDIDPRWQRSFLKYTQGMLRVQLSNILSLSQSDLPVSIDTDSLRQVGDEMIEKEKTYWSEAGSFTVKR
jgi:hypothetical protein